MSIFELTRKYLSACHEDTSNKKMKTGNVVVVISDTSNEWNLAAVTLAEQREKPVRLRNTMVCFPSVEAKSRQVDVPSYSTLDWNALAIANLAKTRKEKEI